MTDRGGILFSISDWEANIRAVLPDHDLSFNSFQTIDLENFDLVIPLCLEDQRHINQRLLDSPRIPAVVPSDRCMDLCDDKERFASHVAELNLDRILVPQLDVNEFPYILKPRSGLWGIDTLIIHNAFDEEAQLERIASGQYLKQQYIVSDQECSSHILMDGGKIRFMGSIRFGFDSDHYVKGINKEPISMQRVDHSHLLPSFERILNSMGYQGICCFDYKMIESKACLFEINPRYGASMTAFLVEALPIYRRMIAARLGSDLAPTVMASVDDRVARCQELLERRHLDVKTALRLEGECHAEMLRLAEAYRDQAIRYAIAGADLCEALLRDDAERPDWLEVHEEQCCRYGGIWIHEQFQHQQPANSPWCRRGIALLDRLQQLHSEPLPWAMGMQADLRRWAGTTLETPSEGLAGEASSDWQAIIETHPLESQDPGAWLRYGVALLQAITPGPDQTRQQQQAALAFLQARQLGASAAEVATAKQQAVLLSLKQSLLLAGLEL